MTNMKPAVNAINLLVNSKRNQAEIIKGRKEIQFKEIHFEIPSFLPKEEIPEKWDGSFGIGYRHMIRFFAFQIWDIMDSLGYDWFFRMDDDSFIHSKIDYNLFEFMEKNGYEYGYRVMIKEPNRCSHGFGETVLAYLYSENIKPTFFYENVDLSYLKYLRWSEPLKNLARRIVMKINKQKKYKLYKMDLGTYGSIPQRGSIFQYNLWGYYNNFFITKVSFWKRPDVQSFLKHIDRIGGGYKYRWGDLMQQTSAVQIFMPKNKVYKFTDWTYEHVTLSKDGKNVVWGGIYEGAKDKNSDAVKEFVARFGKTKPDYVESF